MYWVGFDVGGTFVDILSLDTETGRIHALKHRSSRSDAASAVRDGLCTNLSAVEGLPRDDRNDGTTGEWVNLTHYFKVLSSRCFFSARLRSARSPRRHR